MDERVEFFRCWKLSQLYRRAQLELFSARQAVGSPPLAAAPVRRFGDDLLKDEASTG